MILAHLLVERADVGGLAELERNAKRIERWAPHPAVAEGAADDDQSVSLLAAVLGALIGDVGGGAGALLERDAVAIDHHADLLKGAGEPQPGRAVVGRLGDDL